MSKKKNHKKSSGEQAKTLCGVALENWLTEYFALDQFRKSTQGASSAWEGFQRQTAYICSRIASCSDADYYPETVEDLAVVHLDKSLELVQIKSVSDDFSLSKLKPERADSFFCPCLPLLSHRGCCHPQGCCIRKTRARNGGLRRRGGASESVD